MIQCIYFFIIIISTNCTKFWSYIILATVLIHSIWMAPSFLGMSATEPLFTFGKPLFCLDMMRQRSILCVTIHCTGTTSFIYNGVVFIFNVYFVFLLS